MKNKKYLAWFDTSQSLNGIMATSHFLIKKLSENFEKFYMINFKNLRSHTDFLTHVYYEPKEIFTLPNNVIIFEHYSF